MAQSMKTPQQQHVVVVGGGIGGVAAALALRSQGASVTLLERAPEFGEVGAGIQLAPNATRLLAQWGLLERVREFSVEPAHIVFRDARTGEELTRQRTDGAFAERYGAPYLVVHRSDLHAVLVQTAREQGVNLVNGVQVDRVETVDGIATTYASDGTTYRSDVVLGADGLQSRLRTQLSDDGVVGSGYVAYRGALPIENITHLGDLEDVVVWLGPECHLVQYPLRKGELFNTVAVFRSPSFVRGEEPFGTVEELHAAYAECVPEVRSALDNLWQSMRWPMYDREPIPNWIDGRLGLMGDAAHPMLQYLAQGGCQALEDAAALETLVQGTVYDGATTNPLAWDAVLEGFQKLRAPRTARVQTTARTWGDAWHVREALPQTLRNMLFKARRDTDYDYTDWLYGDHSAEVRAERDRIAAGLTHDAVA